MRDVVYYVGHNGIAGDFPPCDLRGAYMFEIEAAVNELHPPDFVVDVSDHVEVNFEAIQCKARAAVFGRGAGKAFKDDYETQTRFWGMRYGVKFAEPFWQSYGSMDMTAIARKVKVQPNLPVRG
jgi:hypothetical protein